MGKDFFISVFNASSGVLLSILLIVIINKIVILLIEWKKTRKRTLSIRKRKEAFLIKQNIRVLSQVSLINN
jgi:hypothetical protein